MLIAVAQDTAGAAAAEPWYRRAEATFVTLVDESHTLSSLYNLVNVPTAVWIDESGHVRRMDEGAYAEVHRDGSFEFGRADYVPMVLDWVAHGDGSRWVKPVGTIDIPVKSSEQALAEAAFKLGVYFHQKGMADKANRYWERAQALDPSSWNYHRQDWSFTPDEAGPRWLEKYRALQGKPYYRPIEGLDAAQ